MTRRIRFLLLLPLLWLTLLALPAGAAVPPCHHAGMGPHAAHHAMGAEAVHQDVGAPHAQPGSVKACAPHGPGCGHDHGHCVNCPACCAGAALAPAPLTGPPAAGPDFVAIPFRAGHLPRVAPSLPERPPRPSFA